MIAPSNANIKKKPRLAFNWRRIATWGGLSSIAIGFVCALMYTSSHSEQDEQTKAEPIKGRIAEVEPVKVSPKAPAPEEPKVKDYAKLSNWDLRHLPMEETNNLTQAQIEYWKMFHPWPPPDKHQPASKKPRYAIFDTRADNEIAFILNTEPGQMVIGKRDVDGGFEERFLKSITRPIIVHEEDSDYDKELKRAVIAAKIELKEAYDRGEDIVEIMNSSREELQRLGRYKDQLEKEALRQLRAEGTTYEDAEDLVAAVNTMLESKGIAPIEINSMSSLAIKLQTLKPSEELKQ